MTKICNNLDRGLHLTRKSLGMASGVAVDSVSIQVYREQEKVGKEYFVNRNPRNAELLGYKSRIKGWSTDTERICSDYYNRFAIK